MTRWLMVVVIGGLGCAADDARLAVTPTLAGPLMGGSSEPQLVAIGGAERHAVGSLQMDGQVTCTGTLFAEYQSLSESITLWIMIVSIAFWLLGLENKRRAVEATLWALSAYLALLLVATPTLAG